MRFWLFVICSTLGILCAFQPLQADPVMHDVLKTLIDSPDVSAARGIVTTSLREADAFDDFVNYLEAAPQRMVATIPMHAFQALLERGGLGERKINAIIDQIEATPTSSSWRRILLFNRLNFTLLPATLIGLVVGQEEAALSIVAIMLTASALRSLFKLTFELPLQQRILHQIFSYLPDSCPYALLKIPAAKMSIGQK